MCGYERKRSPKNPFPSIKVDLAALDERLDRMHRSAQSSSYGRQKSSLRLEFESFLASLPGTKSLHFTTPRDITRFLVWKDRHGKTLVHVNGCPDGHLQSGASCACPKRLAFKTIDSYIGKLRAVFKDIGRCGEWNASLGFGNPAASPEVQRYLKMSTEEQLQANITPKQAVPLFLPKLLLLARLWTRKMTAQGITSTNLFLLARDQAFFKALFFSADRGSDLGRVKTDEILRFPQDDGLLFNHVWGKTLRDGTSNVFGIRRHPNPELCPVRAIENYVAICSELRITLTEGFLFRPTNPHGHIVDRPFLSSAADGRLKVYLKEANCDEGETLHSFRCGSAITLALSGSQLGDIMSHVGWHNPSTAVYYMKLAEVLRAGGPCDVLSSTDPASSAATELYSDLNRLKQFVSAFPHS